MIGDCKFSWDVDGPFLGAAAVPAADTATSGGNAVGTDFIVRPWNNARQLVIVVAADAATSYDLAVSVRRESDGATFLLGTCEGAAIPAAALRMTGSSIQFISLDRMAGWDGVNGVKIDKNDLDGVAVTASTAATGGAGVLGVTVFGFSTPRRGEEEPNDPKDTLFKAQNPHLYTL